MTFDVTHTLLHTPRMAEIYSEVLRRHGILAKVRDLRRVIPWVWKELSCLADPRRDRFATHPGGARGWWHQFLDRLCRHLEVGPPTRFASAELYERFTKADAWEMYPDVRPTLERLREQGTRLGIVSNWDERLPRLLDNLDLTHLFDAVEHSSASGVEKPHPLIFQRCLERLDVAPENALHVGDRAVEDVEGALAVGMRALRIERQDPCGDLWRLIESMLIWTAPPARRHRDALSGPFGGGHRAR